jgi:hypothetical protein
MVIAQFVAKTVGIGEGYQLALKVIGYQVSWSFDIKGDYGQSISLCLQQN